MSFSMHRLLLNFPTWPLTSKTTASRLHPSACAPSFQRFAHAATQPSEIDNTEFRHGSAVKSPSAPRRSPPVRRRRSWLLHPPTNLLVQRLRDPEAPITSKTWTVLQRVARSRSPRLSVFTLQFILRQNRALMATTLAQFLADPVRWTYRLNSLGLKGIEEEDLRRWIWILEADDTDTKVERLVADDQFVPTFVLFAILRTDEHMVKGSSLVKIYDYFAQTYIGMDRETRRAWNADLVSRTQNSVVKMTPGNFPLLIVRLVHHCLITFPSSLPMIARLVVSYISMIPDKVPRSTFRLTGYGLRCMLFNCALRNFRRSTAQAPLANLSHNWKAQKILLGYSAGLKRPLVIDRWSYRAMRIVLMGLKKSEAEKLAASRYAKTWPPYIKALDGTDEARDKADYLSRSVKAGILKQSEGYSHDLVDHALDNLGGSLPGRAVTIQTRSTPLGLWRFQHTSLQILAYWAAKVKATRNAYEAWQVFNEPPMTGVTPDFQVYAEMFSKLYAAEVDETSTILPGDAKETYPPHLANLTELERERVRPCPPPELYERMVRSGQRPVHQCLSVLIRNAPSLDTAAQYLNDSPLHKEAVHNMTKSLTPVYQQLQRIPIAIFDSYIALLCSKQGRRRWVDSPNHTPELQAFRPYDHLKRAIRLVCTRLGPRRKPGMTPWHTVMRALAHTKLVLRPYVSWAEDDVDALKSMIDLSNAYSTSQGVHPVPFDCLCRCILKVLRDDLPIALENSTVTRRSVKRQQLATEARHHTGVAFCMAKSAFAELITPVSDPTDSRSTPQLYHELSASHIRTYLEVLAKFGDADEGVRVMEWLLASLDKSGVLEKARDPEHKQWLMLREAIVCFRAFVERSDVAPETIEHIKQRFQDLDVQGGAWAWPTSEDVEEYRQWMNEKNKEPEPM